MNDIGERIKALRTARNLTQTELGQALGVTAQAVSKWETGLAAPDISLLVPMARLFDTSVDLLLSADAQSLETALPTSDDRSLETVAVTKKTGGTTSQVAPSLTSCPSCLASIDEDEQHCPDCHHSYPANMSHCSECHSNYHGSQQHCVECHTNYPIDALHCMECHTNYPIDALHCMECHTNYAADQRHCIECHTNYPLGMEHCMECHASYPANVKHCAECHGNYTGETCSTCLDEDGFVDETFTSDEWGEGKHFGITKRDGGIQIRYGKNRIFIGKP